MKKLISVLALLLVATAVFAGLMVKAGGAFALNYQEIFKEENSWFKGGIDFKAQGIGLELGAHTDTSDNFMFYAQVNMAFPKDGQVRQKDVSEEWSYLSEANKWSIQLYSFGAGFAYKHDTKTSKLAFGFGPTFNSAVVKYDTNEYTAQKATQKTVINNIGVGIFVDVRYILNDKIAIGMTTNPQLGVYNMAKVSFTTDKGKDVTQEALDHQGVTSATAEGFSLFYAVPVSFNVTCSF